MNKPLNWSIALCAAAALTTASPLVLGQTTLSPQVAAAIASDAVPPSSPSATTPQMGSGGASFISGGAGAEERTAMDARRGEFPLKLVLSAGGGEYIVAQSLRLSGGKNRTALLDASGVGPWVMIKAPAGSYQLSVTYQDKTQTRNIKLGAGKQQINIRFPG